MESDITKQVPNIVTVLSVTRGHLKPGQYTTEKRHSDCWVFVLSGGGIYGFADQEVAVQAGGILYLAGGSRYTIRVEDPEYRFIFVDFHFDNPQGLIFQNAFFDHSGIREEEARFQELLRLWPTGTVAERVRCLGIMYEIYARLISARVAAYMPQTRRAQLEQAAALFRSRYADPALSVEAAATELGLSEVHFRRLFKSLYRIGPARFLSEVRVNHAKELLAEQEVPVQEIAARCGYTSAYYFSRAFRKLTGVSPTDYRRGGK